MRWINKIIVHCSANKATSKITLEDIRNEHLKRGFKDIGYHYVIFPDGTIKNGRPVEQIGAHCSGQNSHSIGVCYIGGIDAKGKSADTRTAAQKAALVNLLTILTKRYKCPIYGHRDFLRWNDKNKNGIRDNGECLKDCPCFDAHNEYKSLYYSLCQKS